MRPVNCNLFDATVHPDDILDAIPLEDLYDWCAKKGYFLFTDRDDLETYAIENLAFTPVLKGSTHD